MEIQRSAGAGVHLDTATTAGTNGVGTARPHNACGGEMKWGRAVPTPTVAVSRCTPGAVAEAVAGLALIITIPAPPVLAAGLGAPPAQRKLARRLMSDYTFAV